MSSEVSDFLNQTGAKAFPFNNVGDSVSGTVAAANVRQQTDINTGEPKFFSNGNPMMVLVITLQTELRDDDDDDGLRTFWARGGKYTVANGTGTASLVAVKDALRKAGAKEPEIGATMTVTYSGNGVAATRGFSAPKLYTVDYASPVRNINLDELA